MKPQISMRKSLNDPNLFGTALRDASWATWKVLLIAAWGEPLVSDAERETYRALTGRQHEPGARVDEFTLVVGRKGGKSRIMSIIAAYVAALCKHETLVPGERGVVLCVAQSREVAKIVLEFTLGLFEASPLLRPLIAKPHARDVDAHHRHYHRGAHRELPQFAWPELRLRDMRRDCILVQRRAVR
jgi:hypothetical protein